MIIQNKACVGPWTSTNLHKSAIASFEFIKVSL